MWTKDHGSVPNEVELVLADAGVIAIVASPDDELHTYEMTLDEFERLKRAIRETGESYDPSMVV